MDPPAGGGILSASVRRTLKAGEIPSTTIECVHAAVCAGCPLIGADYAQQLATKRQRVVTAAAHYPALELVYTRPLSPGEPIIGYRGRAKLIVAPSGAIGLYGRSGAHDVIDIPHCRVLTPALSEVASRLRTLIAAPPEEARGLLLPYDPLAGGVLRAIDLREVLLPTTRPLSGGPTKDGHAETIAVLCTFVLQRDRAPTRDELKVAGALVRGLLPRVIGVAVNLHDAESPQVLGPETFLIDGVGQAEDRIGDTWHVASFGSFVQVHREQASRIHQLVLREVSSLEFDDRATDPDLVLKRRTPRVLDLYGGSGAISIALAHAQNDVVMVESFGPATQSARVAAELQGLSKSLTVRTGDVAEVVGSLTTAGERFDVVVMNPPRRGVSPAAREAIARIGAQLMIYVSCDPETLARDLDHFSRLGYTSGELMPLDMIPLTEEVETVSVLRRATPPTPRVIYEDEDIIIVDKAPHEPIEPQPEYMVSLIQRCTRAAGAPALQPVHALDAGTSGLCILARTDEALALWSTALAANGRLIYLAAAKGVTPTKGAITRDLREGGRSYPARTRYRRLAVASGHSILRILPDGARSHQIRRHLAAIGHPLLGDERYGHMPTNRYFEEKHGLDRTFLHLLRIEIAHPRTGQRLLVESSLPGDLRAAVERATGSSVLRFLEQKRALGDRRTSSMPPPSTSNLDEMSPFSQGDFEPFSERSISLPPMSSRMGPTSVREVPSPASVRSGSDRPSSVPDLDDAPRTRRHVILSDDD